VKRDGERCGRLEYWVIVSYWKDVTSVGRQSKAQNFPCIFDVPDKTCT